MASMNFSCHIFVNLFNLHEYTPLALEMNVCKDYLEKVWILFEHKQGY
jgi:hypothetical protein